MQNLSPSDKESNTYSFINRFSKCRKILVVDDEYDIALTFKKGLEAGGFHVNMFTSPLDALTHYKSNYYDLLLIDIRMPEMSGFELYKKIRERDENSKVCFITSFLTYYRSLKEDYPEIESTCLIQKPIEIDKLVDQIKAKLQSQ